MDLLLDTHAFIWFMNGDEMFGSDVKNLIINTSNKCFISIASIWEIAIKLSLQKLELHSGFSQILNFLSANDIELLPIDFNHLQTLLTLHFHHKDPFDRVIIAQALTEQLIIVSKDEVFKNYSVKLIW